MCRIFASFNISSIIRCMFVKLVFFTVQIYMDISFKCVGFFASFNISSIIRCMFVSSFFFY